MQKTKPVDDLGERVMRDNRKYGYTQVTDAILTHPTLSRRGKLVYAALLHHARQKDYCWPSQAVLAYECSMSVDTVQRGLCDLRAFDFSEICPKCQPGEPCQLHKDGLVAWKQRGLNQTNMYCITPLYSSYQELEECDVSGKPHIAESKSRKKPDELNLSILPQPQKKREDSNLQAVWKNQEDSKKRWQAWQESVGKREQLSEQTKNLIIDLSHEWGDVEHLISNLTQTANLFLFATQTLHYSEDQFHAILYSVKKSALQGCVQTEKGKSGRMKYFFACLRNKLYGLRE